ncbi:MAG: glycosyltransferase family 4 protein [Puniceicoccaceae bacterium]
MKICYCGPISLQLLGDLVGQGESLPGGYLYPLGAYLVRALHAAGLEVVVVTSCKDAVEAGSREGRGLQIHFTPRRAGIPLMLDAYGRERHLMTRVIRECGADLVHAQWTYEFAHAGVDSGLPCLVTARDAPWEIARYTRSPYRIFRAAYSSTVLKRVRNLSVISPYLEKQFLSMRFAGRIAVVPNGLPEALVASRPVRQTGQRMRFLSVTGWDRRKNPKALIRAFNHIWSENPETHLTVVGKEMGQGGAAQAWAVRKGLDGGIAFHGMVKHSTVIDLMRHSTDVFVHSTREESFCMTILEAMAQGLPVVAFPGSGAVPWLLGKGEAGRIAKGTGWRQLADAMESLAASPGERETLGRKGIQRAAGQFTMDTIAKQYISLYEHILQTNPRSE